MTTDELNRHWLEALLCHFVVLDIVQLEVRTGQLRPVACSGALLSMGDTLFFLTAGHVLRQINDAIQSGVMRIQIARFVDKLDGGVSQQDLIPYEYDSQRVSYIDDCAMGIDFGLIPLEDMYRNLFNHSGKQPITEEEMASDAALECDHFAIVGVPEELDTTQGADLRLHRVSSVALIPLEIPSDGAVRRAKGRAPMLQGYVRGDVDLMSLKGTSGGPVFGFRKSMPGSYVIVGIQSKWDRQTRTAFICPLRVIWALLERTASRIRDLRRQHEAGDMAGPSAGR